MPNEAEVLYHELMVARVQTRLGLNSNGSLKEPALGALLSVASRLALTPVGASDTEISSCKKIAYDIVTAAFEVFPDHRYVIQPVAQLVFARTGNFPAAKLVHNGQEATASLSPYLELETIVRRVENTIKLLDRTLLTLTDFQVRLLDALSRSRSLSVSAPTSAGKSFSLSVEIVRRVGGSKFTCVVYLVPTRALIRQVMYETINHLNEAGLNDVPVLCVPDGNAAESSNRGVVYVLTQERLATLLFAPEMKKSIDVLIVDEAQEIGEDRGLILESVINTTLGRNPHAVVFFSSPLTSNPGYFLSLFGRYDEGEYFVEHLAPVTQNVITIKQVLRHKTQAKIELNLDKETYDVGTIAVDFEFRGGHFAQIARMLAKDDECSILYANGSSEAEDLAQELYELLPASDNLHPKISDLIKFIHTHIHSQYRLADFLSRGVAFHYGRMPQVIRARIEDLLNEKLLRFVCCTSTLLQGINLPAKNIFIQNPKKGIGNPMQSSDFWNLAGRAGRMTKEFDGNVWCIYERKWDSDPLDGDRLGTVESVFERTLRNDIGTVLQFAEAPEPPADGQEVLLPEQVFARIFLQFTLDGQKISESNLATPENRSILDRIDQVCIRLRERAQLTEDVFFRNPTISPDRLEELAAIFRTAQNPSVYLPRLPFESKAAYAATNDLFALLDKVFFKTGKRSHSYYCWLATQWIIGASLKDLVAKKVEAEKAGSDQKKISAAIRKLFDELESVLRFKYVKYLRAYNDVLGAVLTQRGLARMAEQLVPLHLYIEYGAARQTLVSLMSMGLSRTTAILFKNLRNLPDDLDRARCQRHIDLVDVASLQLPEVCLDEIRRIRRVI